MTLECVGCQATVHENDAEPCRWTGCDLPLCGGCADEMGGFCPFHFDALERPHPVEFVGDDPAGGAAA